MNPAVSRPGRVSPMGFLSLHLLLALLWTALWGFSELRFAVGLLVGLAALGIGSRTLGSVVYLRALWAALLLFIAFALDLVVSNLMLARDVLRRRPSFAPAILAFDVSPLGAVHGVLLVTLISLTPGSVCVDLDATERTLFVHTLYARDERQARGKTRRYIGLLRTMSGAPPPRKPRLP